MLGCRASPRESKYKLVSADYYHCFRQLLCGGLPFVPSTLLSSLQPPIPASSWLGLTTQVREFHQTTQRSMWPKGASDRPLWQTVFPAFLTHLFQGLVHSHSLCTCKQQSRWDSITPSQGLPLAASPTVTLPQQSSVAASWEITGLGFL